MDDPEPSPESGQ